MYKILFICTGNICRSPMAEFIFKKLAYDLGREKDFLISSAAISSEEVGNPVYPPVQKKLFEHGINCNGKTARKLLKQDYDKYDLLIGMDRANIHGIYKICGKDYKNKVHLLMDYTDTPGEIADPWFTRDFDKAWSDIFKGCNSLFIYLTIKHTQL